MGQVYKRVLKFKKKYPNTIAWRLEKNASVIEKHLNPGEEVRYVFAAQKNDSVFNIFETAVVCLTSKRILIGRKRVFQDVCCCFWGFDRCKEFAKNKNGKL